MVLSSSLQEWHILALTDNMTRRCERMERWREGWRQRRGEGVLCDSQARGRGRGCWWGGYGGRGCWLGIVSSISFTGLRSWQTAGTLRFRTLNWPLQLRTGADGFIGGWPETLTNACRGELVLLEHTLCLHQRHGSRGLSLLNKNASTLCPFF